MVRGVVPTRRRIWSAYDPAGALVSELAPTPATMPKGQYLTAFKKGQISALRAEGFVIREIAEKIGRGHNVVHNYAKSPDIYGSNYRGGRPQAMTPHDKRQFLRDMSNTGDLVNKALARNNIDVGARVYSREVGNSNVFESKCYVGPHVRVSNGCLVGALCSLTAAEQLQENTVIYGENCQRRISAERPMPQSLQLDFLSKILPNYHHLLLASKPPTAPTKR
ncbi:hypothetical protein Aperf_G00000113395 [Anoplocephala perfoliata]